MKPQERINVIPNVRWGLVGCGSVAETKGGPALCRANSSELIAVVSRNEKKAADFARRFGVKRYYSHLGELLRDEEVEAVYLATPPHLHAQQTVACAKAGKHVLCEKPMALTLAECDEMIAAADRAQIHLAVAYYRRWYPAIRKMRDILLAGRIGRPLLIRTQVASRYAPPIGGGVYWRIDPAVAGGGYLWDIGSHRIDLMIHLLGEVHEVSAFADTIVLDAPVEDSACVLLRFVSGAQGVGLFHWNIPNGSDEIEIGGTEGRIVCDMVEGRVRLLAANGTEQWILPPPAITHLGLVKDFVSAIRQGRDNGMSGREGRKTNAILAAAMESSRQQRVICVESPDGPNN